MEVDGHHFITMEFVDGEDLASLLRRIGRLPAAGGVRRTDPAMVVPGMTAVLLDARGSLRELRRVPPERIAERAAVTDRSVPFRAAGLDPRQFRIALFAMLAELAASRLIAGRFRDPLVGTELVIGLLAGAAGTAANVYGVLLLARFTPVAPYNPLFWPSIRAPLGAGHAVLHASSTALTYTLGVVTMLVLTRRLLRNDRAAWIVSGVVIGVSAADASLWTLAAAVYAFRVSLGNKPALAFQPLAD